MKRRRWAPVRHPSTFVPVAGHGTVTAGFNVGSDTLGGRHSDIDQILPEDDLRFLTAE
jgi:hypothetical protein